MTHLTYAIGDIHGRLDLLERAADLIEAHAGERAHEVVCLGDYIDRGPDSRGVIDFLVRKVAKGGYRCLMGNHEAMMIDAMTGGDAEMWLENGGEATLASYPGDPLQEHLLWMAGLPVRLRDDHRVYVHAGLMPGVDLRDQDEETCLWIRQRFLRAEAGTFPFHVVHGHTPCHDDKPDPDAPELLPHRTNLDTMAYASGVLTIGVFDSARPGGPVEVLRVRD